MNNKFKNIITIIIIIIIMVIVGILILIKNLSKNKVTDVRESENDISIIDTLVREDTRVNYYTVKNIVEKYYSSLCDLNKTIDDIQIFEYDEEVKYLQEEFAEEIEVNKKKIYDFFDEKYINETGLTIDNLQQKLGNYKNLYVLINDMYVRDITLTLRAYFVSGTIIEKISQNSESFQLMILMDYTNSTFNIYTQDYIDKHNLYEASKGEEFGKTIFNITNIEKRTYNKYQNEPKTDEEHAKELLKSFTQSIQYNNMEYSYNRLNEQYKNDKFGNLSEYEKYIKKNKKDIISANLKYYKKDVQEGFTQYICVDTKEKYYIFNEYSVMNYELILDMYTVDVLEAVKKYNNLTEEEKVLANINKVISATKDEDYKYVYNKLDNNFKISNFSTQDIFENYIKEKYNKYDKIDFLTYEKIANTHIYNIEITKFNRNKINAQIVMKLNEGTDFVMSFSKTK